MGGKTKIEELEIIKINGQFKAPKRLNDRINFHNILNVINEKSKLSKLLPEEYYDISNPKCWIYHVMKLSEWSKYTASQGGKLGSSNDNVETRENGIRLFQEYCFKEIEKNSTISN